ncbi:MAG: hypothetical protein M3314_15205 [Actinomycetota bacterium]|nr:hypothetical protein [Actinomycetota bacterium]
MTPARLVPLAVLLVWPLVASCGEAGRNLTCRSTNALVLAAQSVPTASMVPCVQLLPAGWSHGRTDVRTGRTRFTLNSDRAGVSAVRVTLAERCDTSRATEIPTDELGTRRFEQVEVVTPGFAGTRFYTFPGGCVSYQFRFQAEGRVLVNEASLALTFVTREKLAEDVRRLSDGRQRL